MTDEQPIIIVVDDHMPEETQEILQSEARRHGVRHVLIVAAGLLAVSSRMNDLMVELGRMQARIPDLSPVLLSAKDHFDAAPLPLYYQRFSAQSRMADCNLAAHYNHAAKWGSGAHNAGHRSRENRHAEAQRNVVAYNNRYNKG